MFLDYDDFINNLDKLRGKTLYHNTLNEYFKIEKIGTKQMTVFWFQWDGESPRKIWRTKDLWDQRLYFNYFEDPEYTSKLENLI